MTLGIRHLYVVAVGLTVAYVMGGCSSSSPQSVDGPDPSITIQVDDDLPNPLAMQSPKLKHLVTPDSEEATNERSQGAGFFISESMFKAIRQHDRIGVKLFLDQGVSPDAQDRHGVSALIVAALSGSPSVVQLLVDCGADPTVRVKGLSAYDVAKELNYRLIMRILEKAETDYQKQHGDEEKK